MSRRFWTSARAQPESANAAPIEITVNDRAATRQAIIMALEGKGIPFIERSEWGAHRAKRSLENDWDYSMLALHHAGRSHTCGANAEQMLAIQKEHQSGSFDDIGYHYGIGCDGTIYEARDIRFKGSGIYRFNTGVISMVLLNNYAYEGEGGGLVGVMHDVLGTANSLPPAQIDATLALVRTLGDFFSIKTFGGHREFPGQSEAGRMCPGKIGMNFVESVRSITGLMRPPLS